MLKILNKSLKPTCPILFHSKVYSNFSTEKPERSMKQTYKKMMSICKPELPKYLSNGAITLVHSAIFMYLPNIYNDLSTLMEMTLQTHSVAEINQTYLLMGGKWAILFTILGVLTYRRRVQFVDISNRIATRMRIVLFGQVLNRDFFKKHEMTQEFVHHLVTDVKNVAQFAGESLFFGIRGLFFAIGGLGCLLYTAPHLSFLALIIMNVFNLMLMGRMTELRRLKESENNAFRKVSTFIGQRFQNIKLIKISHTEAFEQLKFFKEINQFYDLSYKVAKAGGLTYGTIQALGLFSLFGVALTGSYLISTEVTTFSLLASSTYALYLAMGFRGLMNFNTEIMKIMGVYKNIEQKFGQLHLLASYHDKNLMNDAHLIEQKIKKLQDHLYLLENSKGITITLKNIFYSRDNLDNKHSQWIYKNFSHVIKAGSVVGLIGPSGTGKSTLFNLITKLIDPQAGTITFDGKQIDEGLDFSDIQKMISYVTQQNYLFKGTFIENLKYGNHGFDCSNQRLQECLKMTNAYNFVMEKGGLNSIIEEKGANLSGGQRQRIILARALVKNPRLLLMDQATAGIDPESQRIIVQNLSKCRKDMTTIIITHKLEAFKPILTEVIDLGQFIEEDEEQ